MKKCMFRFMLLISMLLIASIAGKSQALKNLSGQEFPEEIRKTLIYNTRGISTTLGQVLDSIKGSIVLIDFWASWCKTCIAESEHTKKIQEDYKTEKIVYLFLSTDIDYKQWLRGLSVINLDGLHYRIEPTQKKPIQNYLKIKGIPYFVLLDTENKIYDPKAPWPHIPKFRDELDMLISLSKIK